MFYKVNEIRMEDDQVGVVLMGKVKVDDNVEVDDGFTIWFSLEEFNNLDEKELRKIIERKIRERIELLKEFYKSKQQPVDDIKVNTLRNFRFGEKDPQE